MFEISLDNLPLMKSASVIRVEDSDIKRRLLDIGLTTGTIIKKCFNNFSNNLSAYLIRNTLIAIRNEDASTVFVEVDKYE